MEADQPDTARRDAIPLEDAFAFAGPDERGLCTAQFYAFNTVVTLQAFAESPASSAGVISADETAQTASNGACVAGHREGGADRNAETRDRCERAATCERAFEAARDRCRFFERAFSRTLPHSDIARLNGARGRWVEIQPETFELLQASLRYCEESGGVFDITMGAAVRLWDFHREVIPDADELRRALDHVNWRNVELREDREGNGPADDAPRGADGGEAAAASALNAADPEADGSDATAGAKSGGEGPSRAARFFARLADPLASVDVGGTAKGFIADDLGRALDSQGIGSFIINLGGNVLARGTKPDGSPWRIGLQDPRHRQEEDAATHIVGAVKLSNASAVTSGVNERGFTRNGVRYHHILDANTGYPVETDIASVTVIAERSLDAEGYSTTLLALGREAGAAFAREHPAIIAAYFIDGKGCVFQA